MTIGSLRGHITLKEDNEVILDLNGIGYKLLLPTSTYESVEVGSHETK